MKTGIGAIFVILAIFTAVMCVSAAEKGIALPKYIGLDACRTCHSTAKIGGSEFAKYQTDPHKDAYKTLLNEQSMKIAGEKGIADPTKSGECMKCHTTAWGKKDQQSDKFKYEEGITCEGCHGPGEKYKSMNIMKDLQQAVANGLIIPGERQCVACHNPESPTYKKFDFKTFWAKIKHGKDVEKKVN